MKKQELRKLAQKIKLEIKDEEEALFLQNFIQLEKSLVKFRQLRLKKTLPLKSLIQKGFSLKVLHQLAKNYLDDSISQETLQKNASALVIKGENNK